jgi:hypothetical protein
MADDHEARRAFATQAPSQPTATPPTDWPATTADMIVGFVDQVKAKTTAPAVTVVRAVVYGLIAGLLGLVVLVLALIGTFRAIDQLRELVVEDRVWVTYLVLGVLFTGIGAVVFAKRKPRS